MDALLRCQVSPGMFSGEVAVRGKTADGSEFSLFVPDKFIDVQGSVTANIPADGRLLVRILARENGLALIRLPGQTFENGQTVTVRDSDIELRPHPVAA